MEKTTSALNAFIDKMWYDILEFLCFFNWKEALGEKMLILLFLALFWLEIGIHTHETSYSSHVLVSESLEIFQNTQLRWFSTHVKQDAYLWIELTTKTFEKPKMTRKFGTVSMLETADYF